MSDAHLRSEVLAQMRLLAQIGRDGKVKRLHDDLAFCIAMDRHKDKITRHKADAQNYKQQGERP